MTQKKKSMIPKIKKSLKNFLTDESGKITKKDALGLSAATMVFSMLNIDNVVASHTNHNPHSNAINTSQNPASYDFHPSNAAVTPNQTRTNTYTIVNSATCNHASGIVNGHFSQVPQVNIYSTRVDFTKWHNNGTSHVNHGSHGSHGSCGRGHW